MSFLENFSEESLSFDTGSIERLKRKLVGVSSKYQGRAEKIDKACVKAIEEYYKQFESIVKDIGMSGYRVGKRKNYKLDIMEEIEGYMQHELSKKLSLDDEECMDILKWGSNEDLIYLVEDTMEMAFDELVCIIQEKLGYQCMEIYEDLEEIIDAQEKKFATLKKESIAFFSSENKTIIDREKNHITSLMEYEIAGKVLQLIG